MLARLPGYARLLLTALVAAAVARPDALAQDGYPNRPIRIVVAIPTGSATDTVARLIAKGWSERLGRQVFVENRPGAGTIIGNEIVAKAKPDGYTLLMNGTALTISPAIYRKIPYDTLHDFAPITVAYFTPNLLVVHPSVPVKSVKEIIALAKAQPDKILYASGGNGTKSHLAMALFASNEGTPRRRRFRGRREFAGRVRRLDQGRAREMGKVGESCGNRADVTEQPSPARRQVRLFGGWRPRKFSSPLMGEGAPKRGAGAPPVGMRP
jgi:hypothetical protein